MELVFCIASPKTLKLVRRSRGGILRKKKENSLWRLKIAGVCGPRFSIKVALPRAKRVATVQLLLAWSPREATDLFVCCS